MLEIRMRREWSRGRGPPYALRKDFSFLLPHYVSAGEVYVLTMLQQLLLSSSDYYVSRTTGIFNAWLEIN